MTNLKQMTDEQVMDLYYDLVSKGNLEMSNNNINKAQVHFAELLKVNDEVKARNLTVEEWI